MGTRKSNFDATRNRELFDKYITPCHLDFIRRRSFYIGGRRHGEDVYQEAQIGIFKYIHTYKPEYSLFYWLRRAVLFAFCAYIRKYRRFPLLYDFEGHREPLAYEPTEMIL